MRRQVVVNFWGGPGSGKSTLAAGLYYMLKKNGISSELVTEFAKEACWKEDNFYLRNQSFIKVEQLRKLKMVEGKVDIIVSDSPLLMGLIYPSDEMTPSFNTWIRETWDTFHNLNFLVKRNPDIKEERFGRLEDVIYPSPDNIVLDKLCLDILSTEEHEVVDNKNETLILCKNKAKEAAEYEAKQARPRYWWDSNPSCYVTVD